MNTPTGFNRTYSEQKNSENNALELKKKNFSSNLSNLTDKEKKEKILLEIFYLRCEIDKIEDKKTATSLKKIVKDLETNLSNMFEIYISQKIKKNYVMLKNSEIDLSVLELTKFL